MTGCGERPGEAEFPVAGRLFPFVNFLDEAIAVEPSYRKEIPGAETTDAKVVSADKGDCPPPCPGKVSRWSDDDERDGQCIRQHADSFVASVGGDDAVGAFGKDLVDQRRAEAVGQNKQRDLPRFCFPCATTDSGKDFPARGITHPKGDNNLP